MKACAVTLTTICLLSASMPPLQAQHIKQLIVSSTWGGLGKPARGSAVIKSKDDHYAENGRSIPATELASFEASLKEPPLIKPDSANLGISAKWLADHFQESAKYTLYFDYDTSSPAQKALFHNAFIDEKTIRKRIERLYEGFHTDDYPHMEFKLSFDDGTEWIGISNSQNPYMIPWEIQRNGTKIETYNIQISNSLFAILPKSFPNRSRLTDEGNFAMGLLPELAEDTASDIKERWETLGAEGHAADALETLRTSYQVRNASVNSYHNLDYGTKWDNAKIPHEENLHVDLRRPTWPKNFYLAAILLRQEGRTKGADSLLTNASQYENLIFSVPWINSYYKAHPEDYSWLFFVHDRSLTEKGFHIFAGDMKEIGHEELVSRVQPVQAQAALLEDGKGVYWIVLPDKTAILWRVDSLANVMNWDYKTFPTRRCTDYQTSSGGCSGAVISPDGVIAP